MARVQTPEMASLTVLVGLSSSMVAKQGHDFAMSELGLEIKPPMMSQVTTKKTKCTRVLKLTLDFEYGAFCLLCLSQVVVAKC